MGLSEDTDEFAALFALSPGPPEPPLLEVVDGAEKPEKPVGKKVEVVVTPVCLDSEAPCCLVVPCWGACCCLGISSAGSEEKTFGTDADEVLERSRDPFPSMAALI